MPNHSIEASLVELLVENHAKVSSLEAEQAGSDVHLTSGELVCFGGEETEQLQTTTAFSEYFKHVLVENNDLVL
jgi:hypothetical protein